MFLSIYSSSSSTSKTENQNSFAVNYLINTLGFSPEKASSASNYLKFESPEKPNAVVAFLKNHGFTGQQIGRLTKTFPVIILRNPQNALLPKIEFFQSLGLPDSQVIKILLLSPCITIRSLERQIVRRKWNLSKPIETRHRGIAWDLESRLLPNVEVLKGAGAPITRIVYLLQYYPRMVDQDPERFRKIVEDVKRIGLDPLGVSFVAALHILAVMSKYGWENRMAAYKKWSFSENEIMAAFGKYPHFMIKSLDKITGVMDFFVNKMGLDYSFLLKAPQLVSYSFDERFKPRSSVYTKLLENGLIKKGKSSRLASMCKCSEKDFLKRYVLCHDEIALELLDMYQKELVISNSKKLQRSS